jgi:RNA polymerase sigma-70 factor (ECF subfamily)
VRDRRPNVSLPPGPEPEDLDPAVSPEGTALAGEETAEVHHLLARLSPSQRAVVELRLSGLLTREIADVLGMTPDAVKVAQWRAFKRLREWMERDDEEQGSTETTDA